MIHLGEELFPSGSGGDATTEFNEDSYLIDQEPHKSVPRSLDSKALDSIVPEPRLDAEFGPVKPAEISEVRKTILPGIDENGFEKSAPCKSSRFLRDTCDDVSSDSELVNLKKWLTIALTQHRHEASETVKTHISLLQIALLENIASLRADLKFSGERDLKFSGERDLKFSGERELKVPGERELKIPGERSSSKGMLTPIPKEYQRCEVQQPREPSFRSGQGQTLLNGTSALEACIPDSVIHSVHNRQPELIDLPFDDDPTSLDYSCRDAEHRKNGLETLDEETVLDDQHALDNPFGTLVSNSLKTHGHGSHVGFASSSFASSSGRQSATSVLTSGTNTPDDRTSSIKHHWEHTHQHEDVINCRGSSVVYNSQGVGVRRPTYRAKRNQGLIAVLEAIPAIVIILNAITIGVSADLESEAVVWKVLEIFFVSVYAVEFIVKFWYYGPTKYFCDTRERGWNWFDFICLCTSLIDLAMMYAVSFMDSNLADNNDILGLMKVLRLARLARLVRALHFSIFEELKQMVLGVVAGVRVLLWAIVLLLVCIFFLGVMLKSIWTHEEGFNTVLTAMFTVFRCFTDGCVAYDGTPLGVRLFRKYGIVMFFGYVLTYMLLSVGIFNLIMALFIDNIFGRSLKRKLEELGANQETIELRIKETLVKLVHDSHPEWSQGFFGESGGLSHHGEHGGQLASGSEIDFIAAFSAMAHDGQVEITKEIFWQWLKKYELHAMLEEADIETAEKEGLFDVLDVDMGGSLGLDELITGLMKLRGPTTKSDIVAVRLKVSYITGMVEDIWHKVIGVTAQP